MARKKTDQDVKALKRAVNALLSSSSAQAARAAAIYIYDTFVGHPKDAREHFARREAAQHSVEPTSISKEDDRELESMPLNPDEGKQ